MVLTGSRSEDERSVGHNVAQTELDATVLDVF